MYGLTIFMPSIGKTPMSEIEMALKSAKGKAERIVFIDNSQSEGFTSSVKSLITNIGGIEIVSHKKRLEMNVNWNSAISMCTTKWMLYLHDDDELIALPNQNELCYKADTGLICVKYEISWHKEKKTQEKKAHGNVCDIILDCPKFCSTIINVEHLKALGGWDTRCGFFSDLDIFLRLSLRYGVINQDQIFGVYKIHGNNSFSVNKNNNYGDGLGQMLKNVYRETDDTNLRQAIAIHGVAYAFETNGVGGRFLKRIYRFVKMMVSDASKK